MKELASNGMMKTLFTNLSTIVDNQSLNPCCNSINRKKLFPDEVHQNPFTKQLEGQKPLSSDENVESAAELTDRSLDKVVDVWNRNSRRIAI